MFSVGYVILIDGLRQSRAWDDWEFVFDNFHEALIAGIDYAKEYKGSSLVQVVPADYALKKRKATNTQDCLTCGEIVLCSEIGKHYTEVHWAN